MKREERLAHTREWLANCVAKNRLKRYRRAYGLDIITALDEVEALGYTYDEDYKQNLRKSAEGVLRAKARPKKPPKKNRGKPSKSKQRGKRRGHSELPAGYGEEFGFDDNYTFIAGFTSGGCPYGTTLEEKEELEHLEESLLYESTTDPFERDQLVIETGINGDEIAGFTMEEYARAAEFMEPAVEEWDDILPDDWPLVKRGQEYKVIEDTLNKDGDHAPK